jgi:hypothetical protein
MDKITSQPFPPGIREERGICGKVAAFVLNKKGYNIPIPSNPACSFALFRTFLESALTKENSGNTLQFEEGVQLMAGKLKLVMKKNDGILLMVNKSDPNKLHFIAFIVENGQLQLYNANNGQLDVYRLRETATATEFDESFSQFFPQYEIVNITFIIRPGMGGRRRKTLKRKTRRRKTRKSRR